MNKININVDMGEGFNIEEKLMPLINFCNISCGAHAGDTSEIKRVVGLAKINAVKIGAHLTLTGKILEEFQLKLLGVN